MSTNGMVPEGQYTSMVYTAIKDARFPEAVHLLTSELGVSKIQKIWFESLCVPKNENEIPSLSLSCVHAGSSIDLEIHRLRSTHLVDYAPNSLIDRIFLEIGRRCLC